MPDSIARAAQILKKSRRVVALTGAGISVASGIPPFRGKGGIWERFDPMEVAHIQSFMQNPKKVWDLLIREMKEILDRAVPNPAHLGFYELEKMGRLEAIITQNVDGLHQKANSSLVIEFHGNFAQQRCMDCNAMLPTSQVSLDVLPPLCECGGVLRPDCVFFGEAIPVDALEQSNMLASTCDCMIVAGTSAVVYPAAALPGIAKAAGASIIEINLEPTHLSSGMSDVSIYEDAGRAIEKIIGQMGR
ncbi:MAG: NAD-dependent deacylase [Desulfatibacillaceae bacterium]|nr:NAD-dependent deacylase [Desulfatibacillaceae bacterium]